MTKLYEFEAQRRNVTPAQFFGYCRREALKRTGIDLLPMWIDSLSDFEKPLCESDIMNSCEVCRIVPYHYHLYLNGNYNFIMDFDHDNEKIGYGYCYIMEFER